MNLNIISISSKRNRQYFFDLILKNAQAGLRAEISRGYLGMLWWIIEPLIYMGVFYVVFGHLMHRGDNNYVIFLLLGLIVWKWFHTTVNTGANSLMNNKGLMNLVYVPKIVFPLTNVVVNTFKFFLVFFLFIVIVQFASIKPSIYWLWLPVLILIQLFLIIAVTSLLASVMPFFPDLHFILDNILLMLLFLSGIFFNISNLPKHLQKYLKLNPIAAVIDMFRQVILSGVSPDLGELACVIIFSFFIFLAALFFLRRFDRIYPKIIH